MRRLSYMNETIQLSARQKAILNLLAQRSNLAREQIAENLADLYPASKATLARDLGTLLERNLIETVGSGPSTMYRTKSPHPLLQYVDLTQYFALEPDERKHALRSFSKDVIGKLPGVLSASDIQELNTIYRPFNAMTQRLDPTIRQRELERYMIELSWKSSKIEGNTYTLLETEVLIKQGTEAAGKTKQEAIMILNHKDAFSKIVAHRADFRKLTITNLFQLHNSLTKNLNISSGIRKQAVGITGTTYVPLGNEYVIREALEHTVAVVNGVEHPLEKAMIIATMIAYLQPFADGNKRSARMMANALLLAHDYFPLSYRSVDENEYKEALILFYETNNLYHIKRLFIDQYRFALSTYLL